ncbi:membrane protein [Spirochaetia bacterium]|nr:membrane protein [Spirochaetia bacterium]GHU31581.1 membrane protein [Spirochaetia bacterium]
MASPAWNGELVGTKLIARIIIDIAITLLLLCAYAYRITGDAAHEWIGVCVFVLCIAHNVINRTWYKTILKGTYTSRRAVMTACNAALVFTFAIVLLTGLLQSRVVLVFLHLPGGMLLRQIHTTAAYWGLPLIGVHLGLHWGLFVKGMHKKACINGESRARALTAKLTAFLFAAFGVWASFDRDMFAKLFLGFSFDYWDESRPVILFFAALLSIMAVYVFVTYYTLQIAERQKRKEPKAV